MESTFQPARFKALRRCGMQTHQHAALDARLLYPRSALTQDAPTAPLRPRQSSRPRASVQEAHKKKNAAERLSK